MSKPVLLMLLSRHPYAEKSGRGFMLRQRIEQAQRRFETRIVVVGHAADDESDAGLVFLPMPGPFGVLRNAAALSKAPMQTWLYHSAAGRARVADLARDAGAVYVDMLRLAPLARDAPAHVARVIDYDDRLSARYKLAASDDYDVMGFLSHRMGPMAHAARFLSRPLLRMESARCDVYERETAEIADLVLLTSPHEAQALAARNAMAAPPMITPLTAPPPGRRIIFLGNLRYAENVTTLRALAGAVRTMRVQGDWPDDALIEVVGDYPEGLPSQYDLRSFSFVGRIADLQALAGAGVFLAPVVSGSGVKIKVLDGMALGCPVVATPKAVEGLDARANRDLLIAATPAAVLRAALRLRDKDRLKRMLAARARAYLERAHSAAIGERFCDAIEAAIARRQETL
ncbi:MAG TPA: glycosyltransferase [Vitreimonas sp.]|nr:glycosyltransferase [Vitreimonas sp.]